MNVIRIPTKFSRTIRRLSKEDKLKLFESLLDIWDGIKKEIPDSLYGDTLSLIYWEWMNMEQKNWNKPKESLIYYPSEWKRDSSAGDSAGDSDSRVEYSRVEENRIEESKIENKEISKEISPTQNFTINTKDILKKYKITEEDLIEEYQLFIGYWRAILLKWRDKWKERWQWEKTFDPSLRFHTWLNNSKKWSKRVMVNSDDEERKQKIAEIERKKKELFNKF